MRPADWAFIAFVFVWCFVIYAMLRTLNRYANKKGR